MTDRASAEGHRYDHDGMHRHHHEYGPTGRAIWWENADQFGGDFTEHTHADRADLVDALDAAREALRDQFSADHGDDWSVADAARYAEDKATLDKRLAVLAAIVATPDRADLNVEHDGAFDASDVLDRLERFSHRAENKGAVDAEQLRKAIQQLREEAATPDRAADHDKKGV